MKPNKRTLLAQLAKAKKAKDELYTKQRDEEHKARKVVEKRFETLTKAAVGEINRITELLKSCNPFQPGDLIRAVSHADGLLVGSTFQVTNVTDHQQVYARLVRESGRLGSSIERINFSSPQAATWKKVGHSKIGIVPPTKGPRG